MLWMLGSVALACWPTPSCDLARRPLILPETAYPVFLIAGHGTRGSTGNIGVFGQVEAEVTLALTDHLAGFLERTGAYRVDLGRSGDDQPSFGQRLSRLSRSAARVMIEIHTDSRWPTWSWVGESGATFSDDIGPGFAILYNEGGPLGAERQRLAQALARGLVEMGIPPYPNGYEDLYDNDPVPGVYIDRRGLYMLRRPHVPSVIIETHNARDPVEVERWTEPITQEAFASGVARGLAVFAEGATKAR